MGAQRSRSRLVALGVVACAWALGGRGGSPAAAAAAMATAGPPRLPFYMYDERVLDQSYLAGCPGFAELQFSAEGEGLQEANLYRVLHKHPWRTRNASAAVLFYIPLWEYASFRMGRCNGTTHYQRMSAAYRALRRSRYFVRYGGRDHFFASSMAIEVTNAPIHKSAIIEYIDKHKKFDGMTLKIATLRQRLQPMSKLLSETSVGRMKAFGRTPGAETRRHQSIVARCTFDMGHQPNQAALRAFPPAGTPRPHLLFFAGGLDVCCTGRQVRCEVGQLLLGGQKDVVIQIGMRGDVIRQSANGTAPACTLKALKALSAERGAPLASLVNELRAAGGQDDGGTSKYERMGRMMAQSRFCLCPAGDICTTSRFVTSMAAGCIPVVLCDLLEGPYGRSDGPHLTRVPYEDFWIKYPTREFIARPAGLVEMLRSLNATEVARRQAAVRTYRREILLQVSNSNAGTRYLEEVADCVEQNAKRPLGPIIKQELGPLLPPDARASVANVAARVAAADPR